MSNPGITSSRGFRAGPLAPYLSLDAAASLGGSACSSMKLEIPCVLGHVCRARSTSSDEELDAPSCIP